VRKKMRLVFNSLFSVFFVIPRFCFRGLLCEVFSDVPECELYLILISEYSFE
jgi:hypothetical protein